MFQRVGILHPYGLLVNVFRIIWVAVISFCESGTFFSHVNHCKWPGASTTNNNRIYSTGTRPTHVLVIADPQILDSHSYPGRNSWLMWLSQVMVDLNLRKSWRAALRLQPDMIVFLGDMMDGGRASVSDEEYEAYYQRFKRIFRPNSKEPLQMYYLPGNHDVGLGISTEFSEHAMERYISHFGALNHEVEVGEHRLVLIDAPGLVDEEAQRVASGMDYPRWAEIRPKGTIAFVHSLAASNRHKPTVLLTHIPLARPDGAPCGSARERGTIRSGHGFGYQNTLSIQTSQFLLQSTYPELVLSGDDHDYCEYVHTIPTTNNGDASASAHVKEVSVKSFSMAMGIREPGFQLLSLFPPSSRPSTTVADIPCLLPDQLGIYLSIYVPLFIFSLSVLLLANAHRVRTRSRFVSWMPLSARFQNWQFSRIVMCCGRRLRLKLPWFEHDNALAGMDIKRSRPGLLEGWARDILAVSWVPLLFFAWLAWQAY
ncbi:hypothetical protein AcV5_010470 [Taiwanofungus camphoratus]|nr:hypothetical protein AcV5_010470 [Antrodia cinnamomea]